VRDRDDDAYQGESRSILDWCLLFAKPGPWGQIRSYYVWCRQVAGMGDRHEGLRVAIRPELLGQLGLRDLAEVGQDRLADLCERYGCGQRCRAGRGGQRAIELDPDWLCALLDTPGPSESDAVTGESSGARTRESIVTPSPAETSQ
jgi:hypothetical protein